MSQTAHLVDTLKRCLRAKGLTYRDVAGALGLSEASIKRIFAERTFTLKRLEDTCRFLDMTVYDLARLAASRHNPLPDRLTQDQESALASEPRLLSYFYLLLVGWKPARIAGRLGLDEPAQVRCLARLDRLGLIELQPRNRVRLLTDTHIAWRPDGPVRRRYEAQVKKEFVNYRFAGPDDALKIESSELSDASIKVLMRRLDRIAEEFAELTEIDRPLPQDHKRGFGMLLAARPWAYWHLVDGLTART